MTFFSLQCRRILGGRNLVRVGNIVVAAIFDLGQGKIGLAPSPPLFGKFQHGAFASKLRAQRKRLHCRLDFFIRLFFVKLFFGSYKLLVDFVIK